MTDFQVEEITAPAALDDSPAAREFMDAVNVGNAVETATLGTSDFTQEPAEVLPSWSDLEKEPKRMFVARVDGRIAATAVIEWRTEGQAVSFSWLDLHVLPEYQSQGAGRVLADRLEEIARADGRTRIIIRANSPEAPGPRLEPKTAWGSVPRDNREARFLLARGYTLEQITRLNRLALPADPNMLAGHLARAQQKAGADYRLHFWGDQIPPEWREDMALLMTRLAQDVPLAGVPYPGFGDSGRPWTVERLLSEEEKALASPIRHIVAAVEHVPSGRLAGFTGFSVPVKPDRAVMQGPTLVIGEHRGHRLGMLLKIANIQELERQHPGHSAIVTINAEENDFMLDINKALGFVLVTAQGAWTKAI